MINVKDFISLEDCLEMNDKRNYVKCVTQVMKYFKAIVSAGEFVLPKDNFLNHTTLKNNTLRWMCGSPTIGDNYVNYNYPCQFLLDVIEQSGNNEMSFEDKFEVFASTEWSNKSFVIKSDDQCICCGCFVTINYHCGSWEICSYDIQVGNSFHAITTKSCFDAKIEEFYINVPSGELFVFDWFRNECFDLINSYDYGDFSSYKGKVRLADEAANLGFVRVFVGNTSPDIIKDKNGSLIALSNNGSDEYYELVKNHENVSCLTDMHNVIMIDKAILRKLVNLLQEDVSKQDETYDDVINNCCKNKISVEPGRYILKYNAAKSLSPLEIGLNGDVEGFFKMDRQY